MQVTTKQLAQKLKMDYLLVSNLLKLALHMGLVTEVGKVKTSLTGKGKPATVFEVPDSLTFNLCSTENVE
jgi:hypothetical protein